VAAVDVDRQPCVEGVHREVDGFEPERSDEGGDRIGVVVQGEIPGGSVEPPQPGASQATTSYSSARPSS
jgi:hypothetical protein